MHLSLYFLAVEADKSTYNYYIKDEKWFYVFSYFWLWWFRIVVGDLWRILACTQTKGPETGRRAYRGNALLHLELTVVKLISTGASWGGCYQQRTLFNDFLHRCTFHCQMSCQHFSNLIRVLTRVDQYIHKIKGIEFLLILNGIFCHRPKYSWLKDSCRYRESNHLEEISGTENKTPEKRWQRSPNVIVMTR